MPISTTINLAAVADYLRGHAPSEAGPLLLAYRNASLYGQGSVWEAEKALRALYVRVKRARRVPARTPRDGSR